MAIAQAVWWCEQYRPQEITKLTFTGATRVPSWKQSGSGASSRGGGGRTITTTDVAGNTYSSPEPPKNQGSSYVTFGKNAGTYDVSDASGTKATGFKTEKEAKDYISSRETPSMDVGGTIIGSGSIIGHAGEEVSPASAVVGAKTTLERMSEAAAGGQGGSITVGSTTIHLHVDKVKISSDIDLEGHWRRLGMSSTGS